MRSFSADETREALAYPQTIEALRQAFQSDIEVPVRHHHTMRRQSEPAATLLLMPAWEGEDYVGIKILTVTPGNAQRSLPAILGVYLLNDGRTGAPLALIDGPTLTVRRTAAASALAADYLARKDSEHLLMAGTGALAPHLIEAHCAMRPIRRISIWGRRREKAEEVAAGVKQPNVEVQVVDDLEKTVPLADIISCATLSTTPLVQGAWLQPGQHLDLVGAFTPEMRESDDEAVRRSSLFVDTRAGCTQEGGDIVQPLQQGIIEPEAILADLVDLTAGRHAGRTDEKEITLFKSVGTAVEDFAAAKLVLERAGL
ncbi:MAG TPA: ornithine cyclodeaminase family protein [Kiloniellales bacterium]|nr:ornithine cyclodeaminase family protein [Kiloniellales bacterium]